MAGSKSYKARYQADLESARSIDGIRAISKVDAEGQFTFTFSHTLLSPLPQVEVQVVPNEWSSYPAGHSFVAWAVTEIPDPLVEPLSNFIAQSSGLRAQDALAALSQSFVSALTGGSQLDDEDEIMTEAGIESDDEDGFDDFGYESDEDDTFGLGDGEGRRTPQFRAPVKVEQKTLSRIRRDFRTARSLGFKLGVICGFEESVENNIVSLSVRVDKLCLSSETREAWNLNPEDYVVLLIRYAGYYVTLEDALSRGAGLSNIKFRLRKCRHYKPSLRQAIRAFASNAATKSKDAATSEDNESALPDLSLLSIGESIDSFMDSSFLSLLNLRKTSGLSWDQANTELKHLSRHQGSGQSSEYFAISYPSKKRSHDEPCPNDQKKLPEFITKDHLITGQELSLPLIAAQFAMRYFVRCTDYCMVCHQQVEGNFEALKPYVCGDPLCLFQYMSMGLGPSVNQEIRNQPNVVDLLISFCYAGLQVNRSNSGGGRGVRDLPTGLSLQVPRIFKMGSTTQYAKPAGLTTFPGGSSQTIGSINPGHQSPLDGSFMYNELMLVEPCKGLLDRNASTFQLFSLNDADRFKEGSWIAIVATLLSPDTSNNTKTSVIFHGRVECMVGLTVIFSVVSVLPDANAQVLETSDAYMLPYDQNLDDLDGSKQAAAILMQLQTVPSVAKMRSHLIANPTQQIEKWNQLTPAASKLLRWIVASNRSYIIQVDACPTEDGSEPEAGLARPQEHISGVEGWIQFRFAQGSPEKEVQFQEALKQVNNPYPTILAWHGSALSNWHSIIRQGLNFEQTHNGRAYGNGVYFGHDFNTSLGYSGAGAYRYAQDAAEKPYWPNSALKISSAVSLNELVNLPEQFVCNNNFCMVVQHVHWIQCRCLFIQPKASPPAVVSMGDKGGLDTTSTGEGAQEFPQDPANTAKGTAGRLIVPRGAMPSSQSQGVQQASMSLKQNAVGHMGWSEDEDEEDRTFLTADKEANGNTSTTPFRPGTLDLDTLPRLSPPAYATGQSQKTLSREIQKLQAAQSSTPLHELGWYIDFDKITNMFQWIVELHSFDKDLPLAKDMAKAGITSVVLELRFGRDFPYSPPFVRVIRPRFLPFAAGGGGHVTAGGAMCMELLTNTGWTPISSLEGVFLQVRMAISQTEPRAARLENTMTGARQRDYGIFEAYDAYTRAAHTHGWSIPKDLLEATREMTEEQPQS
ncbi:hypothetical protein PGQ11_009553 [Apiospora arundinis]|uniref:UBC core domain-containing protein n=1 Tax=Apiospora arundinis TaxID=335852 RepID=A0ABR2IK63_9PEZI